MQHYSIVAFLGPSLPIFMSPHVNYKDPWKGFNLQRRIDKRQNTLLILHPQTSLFPVDRTAFYVLFF